MNTGYSGRAGVWGARTGVAVCTAEQEYNALAGLWIDREACMHHA